MGEDMTLYNPFTALPSLRFVHGRMIDGDISKENFTLRITTKDLQTSNHGKSEKLISSTVLLI